MLNNSEVFSIAHAVRHVQGVADTCPSLFYVLASYTKQNHCYHWQPHNRHNQCYDMLLLMPERSAACRSAPPAPDFHHGSQT